MSRYVVDANVAIKWYLPEVHDEVARRLLENAHTLIVPDLLFSECGNILWKRVRSGQVTREEAQAVLQSLGSLDIEVSPSLSLALPALEIACLTNRSVYDSLYLALAIHEGTVMVTADEKFYNALLSTPMAPYLLWVEDIPA